MYELLMRMVNRRNELATEAPALILSLMIAELFYKFHSFTLECVAFLATWLAVSALATWVAGLLSRKGAGPSSSSVNS